MLNLDSDFKRLFPKLDFTLKDFQKKAISNVVEKDSTLCIMPTGGGKSAIYWMAAVELNGICIVISPLTALIAEQAQKIEEQGYETLEIHGGIDPMKQMSIMSDFANRKFAFEGSTVKPSARRRSAVSARVASMTRQLAM